MGTPAREFNDNRPDLEGNEEISTGQTGIAATQNDDSEQTEQVQTTASFTPFAIAGELFTGWFNDNVRRLPNPTIRLGTKTATVIELRDDGTLVCALPLETAQGAEAQSTEQFVAFDASYLDMLLKKFAAANV